MKLGFFQFLLIFCLSSCKSSISAGQSSPSQEEGLFANQDFSQNHDSYDGVWEFTEAAEAGFRMSVRYSLSENKIMISQKCELQESVKYKTIEIPVRLEHSLAYADEGKVIVTLLGSSNISISSANAQCFLRLEAGERLTHSPDGELSIVSFPPSSLRYIIRTVMGEQELEQDVIVDPNEMTALKIL